MTAPAAPPWITLDEVDSTNLELRRRCDRERLASGTVLTADRQIAGRGRLGRSWHSPPRVGLYMSVLLRPRGAADLAPRHTLGGALAVCEACRELCAVPATIKWPNDVLHGGRKLAGVLAELRAAAHGGPSELILGIGINVDHVETDFPEDLRTHATSLRLAAAGAKIDRMALARDVARRVADVADAIDGGRWPEIVERYAALAPAVRGARLRVRLADGSSRSGAAAGIGTRGALQVELDDGSHTELHAGEAVEFVD